MIDDKQIANNIANKIYELSIFSNNNRYKRLNVVEFRNILKIENNENTFVDNDAFEKIVVVEVFRSRTNFTIIFEITS